jgi:ectoine hydroxylase-related dioxygenase (phytanoyl-CoA dioxygenase family)
MNLPQKYNIEENGFAVFKNALPKEVVQKLIKATDQAMNESKNKKDLLAINQTGHVQKILYMFDKGDIFLKTLVHPSILQILTTLHPCPKQLVPTWEDMLIKVPFEGVPVTVHQDLALQSVNHDVFSLGIYLHGSFSNPVYYLPKSHRLGPLTRHAIYDIYEKHKKDFTPVYAEAGDIIVHNVKTVHYSEENKTKDPRYTWYLEFRTLDQLRTDSPWDEGWISARRALWVHTLKKTIQNPSDWMEDDELKNQVVPTTFRVCHTNETISYDPTNPYNHFTEDTQ